MTTARDIIKSALRKIQVLGTGTSLSNEEAQDALSALNTMLASFSVEGGTVFYVESETFSLVSGKDSYTIGEGGDFDTTRPYSIQSAFTSMGGIDYPLTSYDSNQYAGITQKQNLGIPEIFYYDNNFPVAKMFLYSVPTGVSTITINSRKHLNEFSTLDSVYAMPPEYLAMLEFNLATWMAAEYEREPLPSVQRIANRTYNAVIAQNKRSDNNISSIDAPSPENQSTYSSIYLGYF